MPRKPRIEYPGALYHVITRGNQQQNIFKEEEDFQQYLNILIRYKKRHDFKLFSYVLMSNHVHLLLETGEVPLSKICQGINQSYTVWFNKKYNLSGHLFQGRYKAIICDKDSYLLSLLKYIHLNPVRVGMVKRADEYRWSSHKIYAEDHQEIGLIDRNEVLGIFSSTGSNARKLFQTYINNEEMIEKEHVYRTVEQQILGGESFLDEVVKRSNVSIKKQRKPKEYSLNEISKALEKAYDISVSLLREKGKSLIATEAKKVFSLIATEYGFTGREISLFIAKDPSVISRYLKEKSVFEEKVEEVLRILEKMKVNRQA